MGFSAGIGEFIARSIGGILVGAIDRLAFPVVQSLAAQSQLPALVAAGFPRVVIVGDGGAGKSTILKQMLARAGSSGRVPVWVSLSSLPPDGQLTIATLVDHLVRQAHRDLRLREVNDAFFQSLVDEGRLTIGFDALDECGSLTRRQKVRGLIVEVAREWKRCQVFVTSRPDALRETPLPLIPPDRALNDKPGAEDFFAFEPVPFSRDDVATFLKVAFDDDGQLAQTLLMRTGIEALLETPLTLTLVGLVARTSKAGLPATRAPLFAQCLTTVCETWDDLKGAANADGLDPLQRLDVLRRLGWETQQAEGNVLGAREARRALAREAEYATQGRAEVIVNGLARRNLLLRAETADGSGLEVQRIHFAHPQFREYLAGAHLAKQFSRDEKAAAAAMAPHWFDSGWLEVLRFTVATVENDAELRDALLAAIMRAEDPLRDLLHRPEFLIARLAARLPAADARLMTQVVETLERAASEEPALRDEAARSLLTLTKHPPAQPAIRRFAQGNGVAAAFPDDDGQSGYQRLDSFHWRLRAIEAHALAGSDAEARALLQALPTLNLQTVLEACELRTRLGDRAGALALWKEHFDREPHSRASIAASMDKANEGARFDTWLQQCLAAGVPTVGDAALGRQRNVAADYAAIWTRIFEDATMALPALGDEESFAPSSIADAVYAALETDPVGGQILPAQRALAAAALRHPAFTWFVGGKVRGRFPEIEAEAVDQLLRYVLQSLETASAPRNPSRVRGAVHALCDEADDALAVPALLKLLGQFDPLERWGQAVAASLARRGQAAQGIEVLRPMLVLPASVSDRQPDDLSRRRDITWHIARQLDPAATLRLLDQMYRSGEPSEDAHRLMGIWNVSGVSGLARNWFAEVARDGDAGRLFLFTLTTNERDTGFTDEARHALNGGVFARDEEYPIPPRTLADHERAFESALKHGTYFDKWDREREVTVAHLLGLLAAIAELDPACALRHADAWVERSLKDEESASAAKAEWLAELLYGLARQGLSDARWIEPVAAFARSLAPAERVGLIEWLGANA